MLAHCAVSYAGPAGDAGLYPLIDMTAARLQIARQVALAKWDTNQPVEDLPREAKVIEATVEEARALGVPTKLATHFFSDQIEANKLVQYGLLARWRLMGHAPHERRANLAAEIRPHLDIIQKSLISALADTNVLRAQSDCRLKLAQATQKYVSTHAFDPLYAIAMDRALARVCEP
ncbi:chorismate mutase [Paraburkholderia sp. NMBU_R16]|uniref:chorismate mutase n=1 Tax=Paraburkholderia sp. NMBU_R16 TaxID=2698676 RepID=UPI0015679CF8|nr:chorismate mutase [Paraburkholderia sp. NMBU_R16]NRO99576.1 chorismate mutase [Paraburkholderia sp. NMBU_R16]